MGPHYASAKSAVCRCANCVQPGQRSGRSDNLRSGLLCQIDEIKIGQKLCHRHNHQLAPQTNGWFGKVGKPLRRQRLDNHIGMVGQVRQFNGHRWCIKTLNKRHCFLNRRGRNSNELEAGHTLIKPACHWQSDRTESTDGDSYWFEIGYHRSP